MPLGSLSSSFPFLAPTSAQRRSGGAGTGVLGPRSQACCDRLGRGSSPSWNLPATCCFLALGSSSERPAAAGSALGFSTENERLQVWRVVFFSVRHHPSGAAGSRREVRSQRSRRDADILQNIPTPRCKHSGEKQKGGEPPPRVRSVSTKPLIVCGHGCPDHTHLRLAATPAEWRLHIRDGGQRKQTRRMNKRKNGGEGWNPGRGEGGA